LGLALGVKELALGAGCWDWLHEGWLWQISSRSWLMGLGLKLALGGLALGVGTWGLALSVLALVNLFKGLALVRGSGR
jgi:hypothetical protein